MFCLTSKSVCVLALISLATSSLGFAEDLFQCDGPGIHLQFFREPGDEAFYAEYHTQGFDITSAPLEMTKRGTQTVYISGFNGKTFELNLGKDGTADAYYLLPMHFFRTHETVTCSNVENHASGTEK